MIYLFDAHDVFATLAGSDTASIALAAGLALGAQFFTALRLQQLLAVQDITLSLCRLYSFCLSAIFYGLVVPGGALASFAVRFVRLSRNARVEPVAVALLMDRVIATALLVVIGAVAIVIDLADPLDAALITAVIVPGAAVFVYGLRQAARVIRGGDIADNEATGRLRRFCLRAGTALQNYSTAGIVQLTIILGASLLAHLCGCLAYYAIAVAAGLDLGFLSICWIRSALILSSMIPVSVAGLGMREIATVGLLVPLGHGEAQAVGYSILVFLGTVVIPGLVGGVADLPGVTAAGCRTPRS